MSFELNSLLVGCYLDNSKFLLTVVDSFNETLQILPSDSSCIIVVEFNVAGVVMILEDVEVAEICEFLTNLVSSQVLH